MEGPDVPKSGTQASGATDRRWPGDDEELALDAQDEIGQLARVDAFRGWIELDAGYLDALRETKVVVAVTLVVFYVVITLGTWSYFRWRARRKGEPAEV